MKRVLIYLSIFIFSVSVVCGVDPALGLTETKVVNGSQISVFVQPHGEKVIVQLVVVGPNADSIRYEDIKVVGIDDTGAEVSVEKLLPKAETFGKIKGEGYGAYKLLLEKEHKLQAIKVTWGQQSVSYPVKEQIR